MAKTSAAKIKANRENALRSTGPKTLAGKKTVGHNSFKHGILSKEIVIQSGEGKENQAEFNNLMNRLWEDLQPQSVLEEILVERIASCYWRLRRAARAEVGEIRRELDTSSWDEAMREIHQFSGDQRMTLCSDKSWEKLRHSSLGLEYLTGIVQQVIEQVEKEGYVSEESLASLIEHFGDEDDSLARWCWQYSKMAEEGPERVADDPEKWGDTPPPEQCKAAILDFLDTEKEQLVKGQEILDQNTNLRLEAKALRLEVPTASDRILRYETTIERQLYRAISELERVQDRRKGEILNSLILMMQAQFCETKPDA